jgi:DNA-binding NtrC family response regulator
MASIMVIDDDIQVRTILREMLEGDGHEVREAGNGSDGIKAFRKRSADLVLCDIFMPEKEGLQTIREMHDEFGRVKIVAMTGGHPQFRQVDVLHLAKKCGAVAALHKPIERRTLVDTLEEILAGEMVGVEI